MPETTDEDNDNRGVPLGGSGLAFLQGDMLLGQTSATPGTMPDSLPSPQPPAPDQPPSSRRGGGFTMRMEHAGAAVMGAIDYVTDLPAKFVDGLRHAINFGGTYSRRAHGVNEYGGKCAAYGVSYICDGLKQAGYGALAAKLNDSRQPTAEDYMQVIDSQDRVVKKSTLEDAGFRRVNFGSWDPAQAAVGDVAVFKGHRDERGKYHPGHFCVCARHDASGKPVWVSDCVQADFGANGFYRELVAENRGYQVFRLDPERARTLNAQLESGHSSAVQVADLHRPSPFGRG